MREQTNIHLQRLIALRDEGFPLAFAAREQGHLDFDVFISDCGTYRCLLGWWVTTPTAQADGWYFWNDWAVWEGLRGSRAAGAYFGIGYKAANLFGSSDMGDLEPRLAFLNDDLIAARMEV